MGATHGKQGKLKLPRSRFKAFGASRVIGHWSSVFGSSSLDVQPEQLAKGMLCSIFRLMQRLLQPEILDSLPPDHPDALHNRRDIYRFNGLMGNFRWFKARLPRLLRPGERALEIGAGDGALGTVLATAGVSYDGLDLWPRPAGWPRDAAWHRTNLLGFAGYADYPVVFGNLIFHQFSDDDLAALGATLGRTARLIIANEPARGRFFQFLARRASSLIGANHVTLHDAHVSVAAGFRGDELPRALGLDEKTWSWRQTTTLRGAYRLIAQRR
jgi:hypothetical protein